MRILPVSWTGMMTSARLIRYIIVGSISYVIEISALFGLNHGLKFSPVKSVAISFWVGFVVAFTLQKLVTFRNFEKKPHILTRQLVGYSLLVAWNYAISLVAVKALTPTISVFIVRTGVIVMVTLWNFFMYRWLFKQYE